MHRHAHHRHAQSNGVPEHGGRDQQELDIGVSAIPRPCDVFDLIVGSSTGGLLAIMLGRLHMSVEECADAYGRISARLFDGGGGAKTLEYGYGGSFDGRFICDRDAARQSCEARDSFLFRPIDGTEVVRTEMEKILHESWMVKADGQARNEPGMTEAVPYDVGELFQETGGLVGQTARCKT